MPERISYSGEAASVARAALYHADVDDALRLFFSTASPAFAGRFTGYDRERVRAELQERLAELDRQTTLSLLTAVEAAFRVDYLRRCEERQRDGISRQFRALHARKGARASFEDDILEIWKANTAGTARLIAELRGAFRFRDWMAHGRYWTPKLGRRYDYLTVYPLAVQALDGFPLMAE